MHDEEFRQAHREAGTGDLDAIERLRWLAMAHDPDAWKRHLELATAPLRAIEARVRQSYDAYKSDVGLAGQWRTVYLRREAARLFTVRHSLFETIVEARRKAGLGNPGKPVTDCEDCLGTGVSIGPRERFRKVKGERVRVDCCSSCFRYDDPFGVSDDLFATRNPLSLGDDRTGYFWVAKPSDCVVCNGDGRPCVCAMGEVLR